MLLVLVLVPTLGSVPEHRVTSLPGLDGAPPRMFSGFVSTPHPNASGVTVHSHYVLVMKKKDLTSYERSHYERSSERSSERSHERSSYERSYEGKSYEGERKIKATGGEKNAEKKNKNKKKANKKEEKKEEKEEEKKYKRPPTVVWMQGGPGGSSMIGMLTENGPLTLNDFSTETAAFNRTGVPTVFENPYSWHTLANVLYLEHPAPTGFSFCEGYTQTNQTGFECPPWDDALQAEASYAFFARFFSEGFYPELAHNDLFFAGESYAGVLVPTLTELLLARRTADNEHTAPWSVKGFALGNDCPGNQVFTCTPYSGWAGTQVALDFRFRHGMISEPLYAKINAACQGQWGTLGAPTSEACRTLLEDPVRPCLAEAGDTYEMGGGYYLYDTCDPDLLALDPKTHRPRAVQPEEYTVAHLLASKKKKEMKMMGKLETMEEVPASASAYSSPLPAEGAWYPNSGTYACGQERNSLVWLNLASVRKALHVRAESAAGRKFSFSTALPGYGFTAHSLLNVYNTTLIKSGLRIMQYSGDADPCVPYVGTERWIESLRMTIQNPWRPWSVNSEVAGYAMRYKTATVVEEADADEATGGGYFDFVTIRDAGHMVPRYKPAASLEMMRAFLDGRVPSLGM
jgi:serine carboxypeptidase-like clade 1